MRWLLFIGSVTVRLRCDSSRVMRIENICYDFSSMSTHRSRRYGWMPQAKMFIKCAIGYEFIKMFNITGIYVIFCSK